MDSTTTPSPFTRRQTLRLIGGASGAVVIGGAAGFMSPASARLAARAISDKASYTAGETMTLTVRERLQRKRTIVIRDSTGAQWTKVSDNGRVARFTATARSARDGLNTVTAKVIRKGDNRVVRARATYSLVGGGVVDPTPEPPPPSGSARFVGDRPDRMMLGLCVTDKSNSNLRWAHSMGLLGAAAQYVSVRRCFIPGWITKSNIDKWANWAESEGVYPVISFKVPGNDWAGVANGKYNADLNLLISHLQTRHQNGRAPVCVAFHHEPSGDGDLATWARMQEFLSNKFAPYKSIFCFTTISNGYDWGPHRGGKGEVQKMYPRSLIDALNRNGHILACDTYDSADPTKLSYSEYDRTSLKITGFVKWARAQGVKRIGLGEFGCHNADDLQKCWDIITANRDIFAYACYFNSGQNSRADWRMIPDGYPPDPAVTSYNDRGGTAVSAARLTAGKRMFTATPAGR